MIRKLIVFSVALVCAMATMPLVPPPRSRIQSSHFLKRTQAIEQSIQSEYRLPRKTAPRVYVIDFDVDFTGEFFTFKGNSSVIFEVLRPSGTVTFHKSNKLDIDRDYTQVIHENGNIQKPIEQTWTIKNEFYTLKFEPTLKSGNYTLKLKWLGRDAGRDLWEPYMGFFRTANPDEKGNYNRYLVTTHFEPTGARSAFPCWDEPGLKAQFEISLKHFSNYTALSNMPVKNREDLPNNKTFTHFERSPKMSPYLLCIAVSDYKHIANPSGNITFYAPEQDLGLLIHALEISVKVITALEAYTGIPYALPKLDQFTLPRYDTPGMEHWGLVSYLLSAVKVKKTKLIPNLLEQDDVMILVVHELTHQWFGNLVSPIWWNDLWLSEGFATYYQYKTIKMMYPDWNVEEFFVIKVVNEESFPAEVSTDQRPKPIKWMPEDKQDIANMFTSVTYTKGSGVLHMLEHVLGEDVFHDGIRQYLQAHQFTAVNTDDLWDDLQKAYDEKHKDAPLDIKSTFDPWLEQRGHPILNVTRDYKTGLTQVTQKTIRKFDKDNRWRIPVNYLTKSNPDSSSTAPRMWIEQNEERVTIPNIDKNDWIILNIKQTGFYQVAYDDENWRRIASYLNTEDYKKIPTVNRAQLIRDAHMVYERNKEFLEILVNLTLYFHQETEYIPWIPAKSIMDEFNELMRNTLAEEIFNKYMLFLLTKVMNHVGFDDHVATDNSGLRTRGLLSSLSCTFEHPECRAAGQRLFEAFLANPSTNSFPKDDWVWIICSGLRKSNETIWDLFMSSQIKNFPNHVYEMRSSYLLCTKDNAIRDKYMRNALISSGRVLEDDIKRNVSTPLDIFLDGNKDDVDYALKYFIDHFDEIESHFHAINDDSSTRRLISMLSGAVKTRDQHEKFKEFLEPRLEALKKKYKDANLDSILENIESNVRSAEQLTDKFHKIMDKKLLELNIINEDKNV